MAGQPGRGVQWWRRAVVLWVLFCLLLLLPETRTTGPSGPCPSGDTTACVRDYPAHLGIGVPGVAALFLVGILVLAIARYAIARRSGSR